MNSYGNIDSRIPADPLAEFWSDGKFGGDGNQGSPPQLQSTQPSATTAVTAFTSPGVPLLPLSGNMWRTEELLSQGLSKRHINEHLRSGSLARVRTGVMVRGAFWNRLSDDGRERAQLAAYCHRTLRITADGLTFSHTSAARLHRLFLWRANQLIHVIIPYHAANGSHAADVRAHTGLLLPGQRIEIDGLPVTSLDRTVLDSALMLNYRQALILLDHALRCGCSREWLESECAGMAGVRGVAAFRKALAFANPLSESPGETLTRDAIAKLGFPEPVLQFRVQTPRGAYRFDFAWPHFRAALEFDGKSKYFDYKPTAEVIFEERQREKLLTERGWRILRIDWKQLFDERGLKVRLLRLLRG